MHLKKNHWFGSPLIDGLINNEQLRDCGKPATNATWELATTRMVILHRRHPQSPPSAGPA